MEEKNVLTRDSIRDLDWDTPHLQVSCTWCPLEILAFICFLSFYFCVVLVFFPQEICKSIVSVTKKYFINYKWYFANLSFPSVSLSHWTHKSFVNHQLKVEVPWLEQKEKISFFCPHQLQLSERFLSWQHCKLKFSRHSFNRPSTNCAIMSL